MSFLKRTWAEVSLDNITHNYREIRSYIRPGCRIMAIVKADAYGHGANVVAKELDAAGADYFGVSNIEEATQLRHAGIEKPILILGFTPAESAGELIRQRLTQTVFNADYAKALSDAAIKAGGRITAHIKVDTGMGRIGFLHNGQGGDTGLKEILDAAKLRGLLFEGVFTHFSVSDEPDNVFTRLQFERFTDAVEKLRRSGLNFEICHCCNSAGLLNDPDMQLDMVRPGIILYGLTPAAGMPLPISLKPAMTLKTVVSQVKTLEANLPVSYGMIYHTHKNTVVATLPVGYADGFMRILSNRADVLVNGHRARVVGRVCMDQCMADVSSIPGVAAGDTVTLIGADGSEAVTMEEFAANMGTVNYEVICLIGKRVPRVFYRGGENVGVMNLICP